jgi:hypothetical protein
MSGRYSRNKGARVEREIVNYLKEKGLDAERIPLSGAMGGSFGGDIRLFDGDKEWKIECKCRSHGFKEIYSFLTDSDAAIIKMDRQEPLIVMRLKDWL